MYIVASAWLIISLILGVVGYFAISARTNNNTARKWSVITFFIGSIISGLALVYSTGWSLPCAGGITAPTGKYKIIGFAPEGYERIHLFLNVPMFGPRMCYIPFSKGAAEKLRKSLDENEELELDLNIVDLIDKLTGADDQEGGERIEPVKRPPEVLKPSTTSGELPPMMEIN